MPAIHFPVVAPYRNLPGLGLQPIVDVALFLGSRHVITSGLLDSGAHATVFSLDVAEALGIPDATQGERVTGRTLADSFDFYLFDVDMKVRFTATRKRFPAQVGFFPVATSRNILGRNLMFAHFLIGFAERRQEVYFRPEE